MYSGVCVCVSVCLCMHMHACMCGCTHSHLGSIEGMELALADLIQYRCGRGMNKSTARE